MGKFISSSAVALIVSSIAIMAPGKAEAVSIGNCQTITQPGSYQLFRNLPGPQGLLPSGDCIVIAADNVTLDLQGHRLTGPGNRFAISDNDVPRTAIVVRNGTIANFGVGVSLTGTLGGTVEKIHTVNVSGNGILVGPNFIVRDNVIAGGDTVAIGAGDGSIVTGNIVRDVSGPPCCAALGAISAGPGAVISGNVATNNDIGYVAFCPSNVFDNVANLNAINDYVFTGVGCRSFNNVPPVVAP